MMSEKGKQFILDNMGCINEYFRKHKLQYKYDDYEDIQQTLLLGLCSKADNYDESKGAPTTFIYRVLDSEWGHLYLYNHRSKRFAPESVASLNVCVDYESGDEFVDILEDSSESIKCDEILAESLIMKLLKEYIDIKKTNQRTVEAFILKYRGYSSKYICEKYNMSAQSLSYHEKKLKEFLKRRYLECQSL